jgi:hypothetical protein
VRSPSAFRVRVSVPAVLSCPVLSCPVLSCPVLSCPVRVCLSAHAKDQATQIQSTKRKAQSAKCKSANTNVRKKVAFQLLVATHAESQNAKEVLLFARLSSLPLLASSFFSSVRLRFFFRFRCRFFVFRPFVLLCLLAFCLAVRAVSLVFFVLLSPRLSSLDGLFKPQPNRASTFVVTVCPRKQISSSVCQFECFFFPLKRPSVSSSCVVFFE